MTTGLEQIHRHKNHPDGYNILAVRNIDVWFLVG